MDRAFVFDVFGTLVDWRTGVAAALREAFDARGIAADPFPLADAWRARYDPAMAPIRAGERGYVPLDLLHRETLDATLEEAGLGAAFGSAERVALARAWERLPAWPDARAGLDRLRPLALLAPCSNASVALSARLARFAGLRWDAIVGAEIARDYKPATAVYRAAADALGLPPDRVTMVAAHEADLRAARDAGLRTAFFPRPREHGPGQATDLSATGEWTWVARDLADLAAQVEADAR